MNIGTDARGVALGDSVVSMASGADAIRWNPGALGTLDSKEVSATHTQYYQDLHIENVSAVYPFEEGGLGASVFYLSPGILDGRDALGNATGDFKYYDLVGTIAAGKKMLTRAEGADVSVGAAIKIVQENIAGDSFQNPALDLGVKASPKDDLNLGLTVRNLASGSANFARQVIGGASYTLFRVFTGAAAVNYSNDAPIRYSVGAEYKIDNIPDVESAVVRAGYETRDSLDDSVDSQVGGLRTAGVAGLTMGAGFIYVPAGMDKIKLAIDYAMAPFGALGIAHTVTLRVKW